MLLRIEDIDRARCKPQFVEALVADLAWLGLEFPPPLLQSTRRDAHDEAIAILWKSGLLYPCFCSRADIAASASAPHGATPVYPGTCRAIAPAVASRRAAREPHALRLDCARAASRAGPLLIRDIEGQETPARPELEGDVVLARRDIGSSYLLASVVDDGFQGVTHIVRGRDLATATHSQRLLQALLGLPAPAYLHHPLLLSAEGRRLAKRDTGETLASLRAAGIDAGWLAERLRREPACGPDRHLPIPGLPDRKDGSESKRRL